MDIPKFVIGHSISAYAVLLLFVTGTSAQWTTRFSRNRSFSRENPNELRPANTAHNVGGGGMGLSLDALLDKTIGGTTQSSGYKPPVWGSVSPDRLQINNCNNAKGFLCVESKRCINEKLLCNQIEDCEDGSDESQQACERKLCLNMNATNKQNAVHLWMCGNVQQCFNISDDAACYGTVTTLTTPLPKSTELPPAPGGCIMPENPENGVYIVGQTPIGTYKSGTYIPQFQALVPQCNSNYKPSPPYSPFSVCISGNWEPSPVECALSCESKSSMETTNVKCRFHGIPLDSCNDAVEGTIATITCQPLHEEPTLQRFPDRICRGGKWNQQFVQCYPMCGIKRPEGVPTIINGKSVKQGSYPWHVGIYDASTKDYKCGGSIVSPRVVLSAAHCFTKLSNGDAYAKENYLVAAGKYYSTYQDERDVFAQYFTINEINIPNRYKGEVTLYEADIAIVVLSTRLNFTLNVLPVCLELRHNTAIEMNVITRILGTVVGWGKTEEDGKPSEELKELTLPVILYEQCDKEVPKDFRRFLTHDKICAGFLNKSQGTCEGDSGGGLVFSENDRYYIRGIVSTAPATVSRTCDSNQYATYTLVSAYLDFIKEYVF